MTALVNVTVSGHGAPRSFISDPPPATVRVYALRATSVDLDAALGEATAADERVPVFSLLADWYNNGNYNHPLSDLTRMVESFTLTQELASDLPAVIGYVEGTAATKLSVVIGGKFVADGFINPDGSYRYEVDTVRLFSPYGPSGPGPLINRGVQLWTGFQTPQGPVSLLQFTGTLSGYSPDAASREVAIDALDPVSKLRRPITQYAFGVDGEMLLQFGDVKYPFSMNNQWLIDRILRHNQYYASPPPGADENMCNLSATMHGSYQQEIGGVAYVTSGYFPGATGTVSIPTFLSGLTAEPDNPYAHPFQMMYPNPGVVYTIKWLCVTAGPMRPGIDGWGMSGWVRLPPAGTTSADATVWSYQPSDRAGPQLCMQLIIIDGVPHAVIIYPSGAVGTYTLGGFSLSNQYQWTFIGIHFQSTTTGVWITMKFGDQYGAVFANIPVPALSYEPAAIAYGVTSVAFTNFSIWYAPAQPGPLDWRGQTWEPTAYVDPGLNWIGGSEDIINRESYDLLKEIVAAEFGTFFFDETDRPHFQSRSILRGWNRAPETLTSDRELSDLVVSVDDSTVRNSIDYEYSVWAVGPWEKIWEPSDPYYFSIPANSVNNYYVPVTDNTPIISETDSVNGVVRWISSELWGSVDDNPYYADKLVFSASLLSDPTQDVWQRLVAGTLPSGNIAFRLRRVDALNAYLTVYNNFPFGMRFATASKIGTNSTTGAADTQMTTEGEPAFRVMGRKLKEYPSNTGTVRHDRSIAMYGLLTYDLGGKSVWRQQGAASQFLAASVLQYTAKPKPVLSDVEVPHNPRRRLYDKIILTEPDSLGASIWCTLHGRSITYSADGARDTLTLRPDTAPPGW